MLGAPLTLPCGVVLANRFAKAALSEQLGTRTAAPTAGLSRLYRCWAEGGAGLVLTGNVMIDRRHLGEPRNVAIESDEHLAALSAWAAAGASDPSGSQLWMQINHPGRQAPRFVDPSPVAPSAVQLKVAGAFATPRVLTGDEIVEVIARFATTAKVARQAGFAGVQLHGAHGYLISQFLSPLTNVRDDEWGGDAERRMRFVLEIVRAVRSEVGAGFPIGIKLNSADFQRGGFGEGESMAVAGALARAGIDLIEVSGGTYEQTAMVGIAGGKAGDGGAAGKAGDSGAAGVPAKGAMKASTRAREAYFIDYALAVRAAIGDVPLMLTGGFRTAAGMADAVATGAADVVGLGRPLTVEPDLPARILRCASAGSDLTDKRLGIKRIDGIAEVAWHTGQLHRIARGRSPRARMPVAAAVAGALVRDGFNAVRRVRG